MMKPILFNTEMVRAILDGRKTVTRRIVKNVEGHWGFDGMEMNPAMVKVRKDGTEYPFDMQGLYAVFEDDDGLIPFPMVKAPYQPGNILYVRETWYYEEHMHNATKDEPDLPSGRYSHRYIFKAAQPDYPVNVGVGRQGWRPSIHMPREAARLFLRVTDVRVERLKNMTNYDLVKDFGLAMEAIVAVGWDTLGSLSWNETIGYKDLSTYGWDANPWVWVIEFDVISKEEAEANDAVFGD